MIYKMIYKIIYDIKILTSRYEMLCKIRTAQIQPRKHVLDHADYAYGSHSAT